MKHLHHLMGSALACTLLLGSLAAHAAPSTRVQASAFAPYGNTAGGTTPEIPGETTATDSSSSTWGEASYVAEARYGSLHVLAQAFTTRIEPYFGSGPLQSIATASAFVHDTLTFAAGAGTEWVEVELTLSLHGVLVGDGQSRGQLEAQVFGSGLLPLPGQIYGGLDTALYYGSFANGKVDKPEMTRRYIVQANTGIDIAYSLSAIAVAEPFNPVAGVLSGSYATVDGSHTAAVYIKVLTPGATLLAESGASYAPVPEPATLWLGLAGVAALALRRMHEVTTVRR